MKRICDHIEKYCNRFRYRRLSSLSIICHLWLVGNHGRYRRHTVQPNPGSSFAPGQGNAKSCNGFYMYGASFTNRDRCRSHVAEIVRHPESLMEESTLSSNCVRVCAIRFWRKAFQQSSFGTCSLFFVFCALVNQTSQYIFAHSAESPLRSVNDKLIIKERLQYPMQWFIDFHPNWCNCVVEHSRFRFVPCKRKTMRSVFVFLL